MILSGSHCKIVCLGLCPITQHLISHTPMSHVPMYHTPTSHTPMSHVPTSHVPMYHTPTSHTPMSHSPMSHVPMSHSPMSQTADLQHLEDFKRELGALVEETLYSLDKKKVQSEKMRECVDSLKAHVDAISASESSPTVSEHTHTHTHKPPIFYTCITVYSVYTIHTNKLLSLL